MENKKRGISSVLLNGDVLIGTVCIAWSVLWIVLATQLPRHAVDDGTPGPHVFPIGISALIILLSLSIIASGVRDRIEYFEFRNTPAGNLIMMAGTVIIFVIYMFIWRYVHYIAAAFVLCFALSLLYGKKWLPSLIFSAIFSPATYLLFAKFLQVMLDIRR